MIQFETAEDVLLKINELKHQGFDTIHLPGGTSKDGSFYAGAVVVAYNVANREVYILGVPYNSNFHVNGGNGHNKKDGETPEQTVIRELFEETGLQIAVENLTLIWSKDIPDNRPGKLGNLHLKRVYLVIEFNDKNFFTLEGPNPIDHETATPLWIPAPLFVKLVFKGHLAAVYSAFDYLCYHFKDYGCSLMNLMNLAR
ncbi:MAG TPA: NUDIX domain-containing protein [Candidatus Paceibacterota bacterium]|nr:NUDIX domain-containing protein [Candidatus Paceibacterota bacterium]